MSSSPTSKLTRIGVFYDGNYFLHVSNYYAFNHPRNSRISLRGLHEFIRNQVAEEENADVRLCQIVDSHFFRGRIPAQEAQQRGNLLYYERVFDDILMWEGVITHYLPIRSTGGRREEKGIDVWMALEAYELTQLKGFDVVILITSDGDYVPLIRKLNTLGTRVMVLSWDFEYTDNEGNFNITRTSQELLDEVTYPVPMHELIETRTRKNDPLINNLFVVRDMSHARSAAPPVRTRIQQSTNTPTPASQLISEEEFESEIVSIKSGYGFIEHSPKNLFFHMSDLLNTTFQDIYEGDTVRFNIGLNQQGEPVAKNINVLFDDAE